MLVLSQICDYGLSLMALNPHQRLASLLLGEPLDSYIKTRRDAKRSWRLIAREIYDKTEGQIDVTPQTLRNWSVNGEASNAAA